MAPLSGLIADSGSEFFSEGCRRMMFLGGTKGVCWGLGDNTPLPLFGFPAVDADFDVALFLSSDF